MKIPQNNIIIEKSSPFEEATFGIGNIGFVLNILRNKLYSSVIESLCREYSCNSRDAHREIGTPDKPIEIHFPNAFENNYIVRDFGIGISPKRMNEVFLQYGNSTKRDSNEFTGGWGIGSKLGFAYSEQFSIVTTNKENEDNIKRTYIAFIDSSQCGKLNLVREEITTEPTGTSIIIPVQDKDIQAFIDGTLKSTQYWSVLPLFFGINPLPEYPNLLGDLLASGANWKIYNTRNNNNYNRSKAESLVIIDGIQYKINESFINPEDHWILACNVHLFFGIGELTLSASRETLQYDDNTTKKINNCIKALQIELSTQIVDILNNKETYIEAVEFYTFMGNHFYKVINKQTLTWRGIKIIGPEVPISQAVMSAVKFQINGYSKHTSNHKTSVKLQKDFKFYISKNNQIYYNDLDPEHTYRSKNIKALESNSYIQIINYIKGKSYDDFLIDIKAEFVKQFNNTILIRYLGDDNSFIFDIIKPINLSTVIEDKIKAGPKLPKPTSAPKNNLIKGYKYIGASSWKLREYFYPYSLDKDIEGCYINTEFKTNSISTKLDDLTTWNFEIKDLTHIKKIIGDINIFSVKEKDLPKFTNLKPLSVVLKDKFNKLIGEDYYKSLALMSIINKYGSKYYQLFSNIDDLKFIGKFKNKIKDKNSIILKYSQYTNELNNSFSEEFLNKMNSYLKINRSKSIYVKEVEYLLNDLKNRYPLLPHLNDIADDFVFVIDYINMCDENYSKQQLKMAVGK